MKGVIIYKGKYGATRQYAEWLQSALQLPVSTPEMLTPEELDKYDLIIAGGSIYMGKWQLRKWLLQYASLLKSKKLFLFIVCGTDPDDKEALDEIAKRNIPIHILNTCSVYFLHGRMIIKQLSWQDRLMLKMGAWLTKDPVKKKAMLRDFDEVGKDRLASILKAIRHEQSQSKV